MQEKTKFKDKRVRVKRNEIVAYQIIPKRNELGFRLLSFSADNSKNRRTIKNNKKKCITIRVLIIVVRLIGKRTNGFRGSIRYEVKIVEVINKTKINNCSLPLKPLLDVDSKLRFVIKLNRNRIFKRGYI